jgi:hypothetical protein
MNVSVSPADFPLPADGFRVCSVADDLSVGEAAAGLQELCIQKSKFQGYPFYTLTDKTTILFFFLFIFLACVYNVDELRLL